MSHHHKPWRPPPAAKPSHLTSLSQPNSLAALQGANLAFAASPKTVDSTAQPQRTQNEYKAAKSKAAEDDGERSPSRGRHLSPVSAQLTGAHRAASTRTSPAPPPLNRSASMIAARLASASPSPGRSLAGTSPPKDVETETSNGIRSGEADARSITTPSRSPRTSPEAGRSGSTAPKLDLDKTPRLPPRNKAPVARRSTSDDNMLQKEQQAAQPVSGPAWRTNLESTTPSTKSESSSGPSAQPVTVKSKPPTPTPRRAARAPLRPNLTGPKQDPGASREEIISRMADAMVASSLASSRPSSPTKAPKHHTFRRRSSSAHNIYRIPPIERQPLPQAPRHLKQTLRKASPDGDGRVEPTKGGRRHLVRKHPNMHHEGDRKRWRDKVTETERKRYEGVFAANRGRLLKSADPKASPSRQVDPNSESNHVVNLVVRDVWERSRLPAHILEQIYDLVAPDDAQLLNREQFVVGLWLIDQKLKGRKLPVKVSDSVWASVRHAQGIKVRGHS